MADRLEPLATLARLELIVKRCAGCGCTFARKDHRERCGVCTSSRETPSS